MSVPAERIPYELAALGFLVHAVERDAHAGAEGGCVLCGAVQRVEGQLQEVLSALVDQVRGEHLLEQGQLYPVYGCAVRYGAGVRGAGAVRNHSLTCTRLRG